MENFTKMASHQRHIQASEKVKHLCFIYYSGRACKPDSVRRCRAHGALQTAAIIPLGPGSHRDSSSLPEGFRFTRLAPRKMECAPLQERRSMSRASSPLLFGLAPRGVFRALAIANEAVGSYPTFSPLPNDASSVRRHAGFPAGCHRAALRRRFNFLWHYP